MAALIAILAIGLGSIYAKPVRIVFHGNRVFSQGELLQMLNVTTGADSISDPVLQQHLSNLVDSLVARDYLFAGVESAYWDTAGTARKRLTIHIAEGSLAAISAVEWLGDSVLAGGEFFETVITRKGAVFRWSSVDFDIQRLLDHFETHGYPFARVEIYRLDTDSAAAQVALQFVIRAGPRTTVEFIAFPGIRQTRESFLMRETRLRIGESYDQRRVDTARRRLKRLEFMGRVDVPAIAANDVGKTGLRIPVEEVHSTHLDMAAGYLPESGGRKAQLTGLVNVDLYNLFGVGRKARIHWEQPDSRIQAIDVAYREPWILGQPLALQFGFGQRIEDTLYVTRKALIRGEVDLSTSLRLWGSLQEEAVITDSAASILLSLPDSRTTYIESGLSLDSRDHPTNPRSGVLFSTWVGTGWRQREQAVGTEPGGAFRQQRLGLDAEVAQEVIPFWIADVSLHARSLETTEPHVLLPDLYRLGGARSLRGYREEQFLGSRVGWTSVEARYWLGPASRVFAFGDAGGVFREQNLGGAATSSTLLRMATGFGLRVETNIGIWGFDYGIGKEDKLLSGKVHVSLLSTF